MNYLISYFFDIFRNIIDMRIEIERTINILIVPIRNINVLIFSDIKKKEKIAKNIP